MYMDIGEEVVLLNKPKTLELNIASEVRKLRSRAQISRAVGLEADIGVAYDTLLQCHTLIRSVAHSR